MQLLIPLAREAVAAGSDVLLTGAAALAAHVSGQALAYVPSGPDLTTFRRAT